MNDLKDTWIRFGGKFSINQVVAYRVLGDPEELRRATVIGITAKDGEYIYKLYVQGKYGPYHILTPECDIEAYE
jgi:hypothetical protein